MLFLFSIQSQGIEIKPILQDSSISSKDFPEYKKNAKDSSEVQLISHNLISALYQLSYLTATIDSTIYNSNTACIYITIGPKIYWAHLKPGNIDPYLLNNVHFKEKIYRQKPFRFDEFHKMEKAIITFSENNGYPFARIKLDSIKIHENEISATLNYQKGPRFTFDSLIVVGSTKTRKKYLMRHLRINLGGIYDQKKINDVYRMLNELPFLSQKRSPQVIFSKNKAILTLFVEDKKINQIDGIIGFLPSEGTDKKLLVTGELNLGLKNLFGTGKGLNVEWKKIKQASQQLDMNYFHPKILGSGVDVKIDFNLFKRDSTFITINRKLNFIQRAGRYGKISINAGLKTSRPLGGVRDTSLVKFADIDLYTYGLGYSLQTLDNLYYPRKGWQFNTLGYIGNKTINPNLDFNPSYYSNVQLKSVQFNWEGQIEKYTRLGRNSVLLTRAMAGKLFNKLDNIFFNDLYQIGGLRTLRGFNENNFYVSEYAIGTLEYRFFTDETSYLLLFFDQSTLTNSISPIRKFDYPFGFGAGVSFTTPAGVFNFVYALGNSADQKVRLNLSKIHFGITNKF